MEEINYQKLHEPYKGEESPSPEAQITWLAKKGIPMEHIQSAMMHVYGELHRGERKFEDADIADSEGKVKKVSAGWQLDNYLLAHARAYHEAGQKALIAHMEKTHVGIVSKGIGKLGFWKRLKVLFTGRVV